MCQQIIQVAIASASRAAAAAAAAAVSSNSCNLHLSGEPHPMVTPLSYRPSCAAQGPPAVMGKLVIFRCFTKTECHLRGESTTNYYVIIFS